MRVTNPEYIQLAWRCSTALGRDVHHPPGRSEAPLTTVFSNPSGFTHNGLFVLRVKTVVTMTNRRRRAHRMTQSEQVSRLSAPQTGRRSGPVVSQCDSQRSVQKFCEQTAAVETHFAFEQCQDNPKICALDERLGVPHSLIGILLALPFDLRVQVECKRRISQQVRRSNRADRVSYFSR